MQPTEQVLYEGVGHRAAFLKTWKFHWWWIFIWWAVVPYIVWKMLRPGRRPYYRITDWMVHVETQKRPQVVYTVELDKIDGMELQSGLWLRLFRVENIRLFTGSLPDRELMLRGIPRTADLYRLLQDRVQEVKRNSFAQRQGRGGPERVVIKEIVKIPCPYCGSYLANTETSCPQCGGSLR